MKYQVIAIMGKSASGKDTVAKETVKRNPDLFHFVVSSTTRPMREGEVHGEDYYFCSIETFTRKVLNGEMLEATEFRDWFYGTAIEALNPNKINICVLNPAGISALLEDPRLNVEIVQVLAEDKTRLMRSLQREKHPDCAEICRRFFADEKDFAEDFQAWPLFNDEGTRRECLDLMYPGNMLTDIIQEMASRILIKHE